MYNLLILFPLCLLIIMLATVTGFLLHFVLEGHLSDKVISDCYLNG